MTLEEVAFLILTCIVAVLCVIIGLLKLEICSLKDRMSSDRVSVITLEECMKVNESETDSKFDALERYLDIQFEYPNQKLQAVSKNNGETQSD